MPYKSKAQKIAERNAADTKRLLTKDWDGNKIWEYNISQADRIGHELEDLEKPKYRQLFKDIDRAGPQELRAFYMELSPISSERERFITFLTGVTADSNRSEQIQKEAAEILQKIKDEVPPYDLPRQ